MRRQSTGMPPALLEFAVRWGWGGDDATAAGDSVLQETPDPGALLS